MTTCPHCESTSWKLNEANVSGANFRYYAIQCSRCSAPATMVEFNNIGAAIEELEQKIDAIESNILSRLSTINHNIGLIASAIKR